MRNSSSQCDEVTICLLPKVAENQLDLYQVTK